MKGYKPHTMLASLTEERDRIKEMLAVDHNELKANLAATERLIAIYEARAAKSAADSQPKTLKAAAKIRAHANGNGSHNGSNGNGSGPHHHLTKRARKDAMMTALLSTLSHGPLQKDAMVDAMKDATGNPTGRGIGTFVARQFIACSKGTNKKRTYSITTKGQKRLAELMKAAAAVTP